MPDDSSTPNRIVALRELIGAMIAQARPRDQLPIKPTVVPADPAYLAREAARSATEIALATAQLGDKGADNQALANVIWQQNLLQIERIQKLHGMPPMPFQAQTKVLGPTT